MPSRSKRGAAASRRLATAAAQAIPDLLLRLDAIGAVLESRAAPGRRGPAANTHVTPAFQAAVARAVARGASETLDYILGAGQRHFEARIVPVGGGEAVAFVRDVTVRRQAEEEVFNSREMLRQILDTIPQRVFWKDRQSVYLGCNAPLARDTGFARPADIVGKDDFDTDSAECAKIYRADDQEVMLSDRAKLHYEEPLVRSDGTRRWLRTSKVPLHDKEGRVIGILGTYEDVTERKQAEALRTGENLILELIVSGAPLRRTLTQLTRMMESLADHMLCSILVVDPDGQRLRSYVAPSLPEKLAAAVDGIAIGEGYGSCGTAAARKDVVIVSDVATSPLWQRYRGLAEEFGVGACWSTPIMAGDKSVLGTFAMYFPQPRTPTPDELQLIHIASHIAGIAIQRRNAEDALRKAEEKYRQIFEHALDGIFRISPQGRILDANPAFARMFGYESPAAMMAAVGDVGRELCLQPLRYAEFARALEAKGFVQRWELAMRPRGHNVLWVSIDARVTRGADGEALCYEGFAENVTERKRLEQQFLQSQKMEAVGQLAGGVAHDFNNLLTVILGNLSLIRLGHLTPEEVKSGLEDSFRSAQRAASLTSQLLTFSRRHPVEPRDIELNELVANLTKMLQPVIGEQIALQASYAPGGVRIHADPGMMEQALMNLALNARDAMPRGGTLTIATAAVEFDAAKAWTTLKGRPGKYVRLSVSDTGVGIAPEHLPHIFEPFFTTKEVGKGTGLGLATVFGIVEQHEGWIDVETEAGRGTTMHIHLPRSASASRSPFPAANAPERPRGGTETILLVEDEDDVRALMSKLLQGHSYRVHAAATGVEALSVWRQHRQEIDLLVTDMVMPGGIGGGELGAQLLAEKPDLSVIYCSGYSDEMIGCHGDWRRDVNFLEKPFDVHEFLERVRRSLDGR